MNSYKKVLPKFFAFIALTLTVSVQAAVLLTAYGSANHTFFGRDNAQSAATQAQYSAIKDAKENADRTCRTQGSTRAQFGSASCTQPQIYFVQGTVNKHKVQISCTVQYSC